MLFIHIILTIALFVLGLTGFYNIYDEIKEDYKTYKQICIYSWQIFEFTIGVILIIISYKMLLLLLQNLEII